MAATEFERFRTGAAKYDAYLKTPEGRLRVDLAFRNLREFLPTGTETLRALDLGGGTGAIAVRLAQLGIQVSVLDASLEMLEFAERVAREAGVAEKIAIKHADAGEIANLFPAGSFDLILCHNLLEYVEDPSAVVRGAARLLRDSTSLLSVLVRNQSGEVLKAAIKAGDLGATEHGLTAEWATESLYGGKVRLFAAGAVRSILHESSLAATAERGVRVISDYLPQTVSREGDHERILALELKLGRRPEFAAVARYTQCFARQASLQKNA